MRATNLSIVYTTVRQYLAFVIMPQTLLSKKQQQQIESVATVNTDD